MFFLTWKSVRKYCKEKLDLIFKRIKVTVNTKYTLVGFECISC